MQQTNTGADKSALVNPTASNLIRTHESKLKNQLH